ncbi:MAG: FAD-dependent oxidoreductase [Firmicutes bacterium]|nr:FAD-dependent oxidoreductase [Bacillota bacterium]
MEKYEVAVIGGGVVGASVFNLLTRKGVNVVMLEACPDVAGGATKANSGIVHSGFHPEPGSLMAKFNVRGTQMFDSMCKRLGVKYFKTGTLTVTNRAGFSELQRLIKRGEANGAGHMQLLNRRDLLLLEPNIADGIECGLLASNGGYVSPYLLTIALSEEGVINGGKIVLDYFADRIEKKGKLYYIYAGKKVVAAKMLVNCAGVKAGYINKLVGDTVFNCNYIKGEYIILAPEEKDFVKRPICMLPTEFGKGVFVTPTEHNVMFGPTAKCCKPDDTGVEPESLDYIKQQSLICVKNPNFKKAIKLFAGVRTKSGFDFVIERSHKNPGFYYAIGICSPGLTAAPAIAEHIVAMMKQDGLTLHDKTLVKRDVPVEFRKLSPAQQKVLVKKNPAYARIVCRCEQITEGEILDAFKSPVLPTTIDALKRRLRVTMGRCQGGFCTSYILKLIESKLNVPMDKISIKGPGSEITLGNIKTGGIYEN